MESVASAGPGSPPRRLGQVFRVELTLPLQRLQLLEVMRQAGVAAPVV